MGSLFFSAQRLLRVLVAFLFTMLISSPSFTDATPPSDVYIYAMMTWTPNSHLDETVANYMSAHKDSAIWPIEQLNNSTDILPNTTLHYVVEEHGNNPITAIRMLNTFLDSATYPVAMIIVEAFDLDVTRRIANIANALDITVGTVIGSRTEFADQRLYSNLLRAVRATHIFVFFLVIVCCFLFVL